MSSDPAQCDSPVGMCTVGALKGALVGGYRLSLSTLIPANNPDIPTLQFFTGTSRITLTGGGTLVGIDAGALNTAPPGWIGSGSFSTLLTLTEGAAGWLHIRGQLDLATGTVTGRYDGTVCAEDTT